MIFHKLDNDKQRGRHENRAFSHVVRATMLVFQNNETAATLVFQLTNPVGGELFPYVNALIFSNRFAWIQAT